MDSDPAGSGSSGGVRVTRLAPSPTGQLHLGNARTLLLTWALARRMGWQVALRIEDLDPSRTRPGDTQRCIDDMSWIGIDWDGDVTVQSARTDMHRRALESLSARGLCYRSAHSRAELRRAAGGPAADEPDTDALHAPHGMAGVVRCPPSLRPPRPGPEWTADAAGANVRLALDPGVERIDERGGDAIALDPLEAFGDPILWTRAGMPAYHLAVCADDIAQGITDVVRGADLKEAAALHTRMWRLLGAQPPRWWHLPLLLDADGTRMAKRQGSLTLAALRESGVTPERVIGLCAWGAGLAGDSALPHPMSADELAQRCDPTAISAWCAAAADPAAATRSRLSDRVLHWLRP